MAVRQPDFAGTWYPSTAEACTRMFESFEPECRDFNEEYELIGGLVPHAGYHYSGRLAYNVMREMVRHRSDQADTVVLFGGHMGPRSPTTIFTEGEFWTPLGNLPVDEDLAQVLCRDMALVSEIPQSYEKDNTIELQLPMIAYTQLARQVLVIRPAPVPDTLGLAARVVEWAGMLGRRLAVIGSTDLTHYGPNYDWAIKGLGAVAETWVRTENDKAFIDLACHFNTDKIMTDAMEKRNACCPGAAAAALECGHLLGSPGAHLLTYGTSNDVRQDVSFVGYAGMVF